MDISHQCGEDFRCAQSRAPGSLCVFWDTEAPAKLRHCLAQGCRLLECFEPPP